MNNLQKTITLAFEQIITLSSLTASNIIKEAVAETLSLLNTGQLRVAEKNDKQWQVHQWIKQAILLSFKLKNNKLLFGNYTHFFDKVPLKYAEYDATQFAHDGVRIVPPAHVRFGAYVGKNAVLMPSFVNIGAYIDEGTMVDTWATVGSCAQIGKNVHLSGGVGIGGVLEPLQANPTIIEDNCFIGARSEIVEGVIVRKNAVISMGVFIGQSTPIYNRMTDQITYGEIPEGAVVIPGSLPSQDGKYNRYCALIMKEVDEKTRAKVSINSLLRDE